MSARIRDLSSELKAEAGADADRAKHRARQFLDVGSDVEIAGRVADDLQALFGEVPHCEGRFWHYCGTHWAAHDEQRLRLLVHSYDGAVRATPSGNPRQVRLGRSRIDSVINELGAILAAPIFFRGHRQASIADQGSLASRPPAAPNSIRTIRITVAVTYCQGVGRTRPT